MRTRRNVLGRVLGMLLLLVMVVLIGGIALVGWLSLTEYKPADVEAVAVTAGARHQETEIGKLYKIVTLNVGYGGLGYQQDFFMDGGKGVLPKDKAEVSANLSGLLSALSLQNADICLLQEVDLDSNRSYWIDQREHFSRGLMMGSAFAYNYNCAFVPFPWPPIGKVESGLLTLNNLAVSEATRESLPVPFSWPIRVANLKRCLLVERMPIAGSEKELVLVNLHLEAYSSQEGRQAQMEQLTQLMRVEAAKGNYVIAGGDFNQAFPGTVEKYPIPADADWLPGQLVQSDLPEGYAFAYDLNVPTCRSLQTPYHGERSELVVYVIDGFIVSDNVKVKSVETYDLNFRNSDHQPVVMEFTLQ